MSSQRWCSDASSTQSYLFPLSGGQTRVIWSTELPYKTQHVVLNKNGTGLLLISYLLIILAVSTDVKGERSESVSINNSDKTKGMKGRVYCITCHLTRAVFSTTGVFLKHN